MNPNNSKVIVIVLCIIALILGGAIYHKNKGSFGLVKNQNITKNPLDDKLTSDEKSLFYNPQKDATKAQLEAFSDLVARKAVEGDTITVKDCVASPTVLHVVFDSTFTVKNTGTADIHFGFENERTLVKAGQSGQIKANYKHGAGIYGYGCDDETLNRSIGLLLITK